MSGKEKVRIQVKSVRKSAKKRETWMKWWSRRRRSLLRKFIGGSHLTWDRGSEGRGLADLEFVTRVTRIFFGSGKFFKI